MHSVPPEAPKPPPDPPMFTEIDQAEVIGQHIERATDRLRREINLTNMLLLVLTTVVVLQWIFG